MLNLPLIATALVFSLVAGANDGATLVAMNLNNRALTPVASIAILAMVVVIEPFVLGTGVATTVAHGLVSFEGQDGGTNFLIAVLVALGVVVVLSRNGLPTSLTLALVGGIVGVAVGRGLPVAWPTVGLALLVGIGAPVASGSLGFLFTRGLARLPLPGGARSQVRFLDGGAFLLQACAYASNDAQKLYAMVAVASGQVVGPIEVHLLSQAAIAFLFTIGILVGVRRYAGRLGQQVMPVRHVYSIAAKLAASVAVLASSAGGVPVSMTQSSTAGLLGAGVSDAVGRVRWAAALPILGAWAVTLPASAFAAAVTAAAVGAIR